MAYSSPSGPKTKTKTVTNVDLLNAIVLELDSIIALLGITLNSDASFNGILVLEYLGTNGVWQNGGTVINGANQQGLINNLSFVSFIGSTQQWFDNTAVNTKIPVSVRIRVSSAATLGTCPIVANYF